ncbi:MarR family transcriptional regulator [Clostridium sp. SHJSY1]|uniref:MarR family winged helix-turn-helix transcriptional regulator n=1 Tax=Clostridium sp. SHJSY1 TaxID=2942483 RepID=UPI00287720D7|nr:MarR family transcriptional regulator [Clostridium sp. SHJSY1]MDS0526010.1 MarR family transcriptional regulator [Clostridium sp. SHJSY1]
MNYNDINFVGKIVNSLLAAKKAIEFMPELPNQMKTSHIRVLHTIYKNRNENQFVRVSDVSISMGITKPSVTKLINELVKLGAVKKSVSDTDKRVILVELTLFGEECVQEYVLNYHTKLAKYFSKLDEKKYISMIETIDFIYQSMEEVSKEES